jgi:2-polyprenyl-3-methyl-5-hydroxy-6-metoxy-1,4-benzoquinol methylase
MADPRPWPEEADRLAHGLGRDDPPHAWFDRLYASAAAGSVTMPWDRAEPHWALAPWTAAHPQLSGRAVQVGCGLGADAEHLASLGLETTAFDVSPTAVEIARGRNPGSSVDYRVADLLDLPDDLRGAFDVVVEIFTVQSVPRSVRPQMVEGVRSLAAPGGRLFVVQARLSGDPEAGPPWPLDRAEIEYFAADPFEQVDLRIVPRPGELTGEFWVGDFRRTAQA